MKAELTLRPINDEDISLLTIWLNKDYILKWYLSVEDWLEEMNGRHGAYSWINHFIVMDGDVPIGFCQYYDCYDAKDMEDWYNVTKKGDTFSIDYLIGDEAYLGKGFGKVIVKRLMDTIQEKERGNQVIAQPDVENHPSNHVLMANGFVYDQQKKYYYKLLK